MRPTPRRAAIAVGALTLFAAGPVTAGLQASATPIAATRSSATTIGSVNASATATGLRAPAFSHQGEDVEADAPYSSSQLGGGGAGHALTTIFWPGSTGAHAGSTIGLLGIKGLPTSLINDLNDPYVAEAPTVSGSNTSSKSTPGITMEAIAKPTHVEATTAIGASGVKGLGEDFGTISATTNIVQTKSEAIIDAKTELSDISIGGVLTIQALISSAHATSNGKTATGTTQTTIAGAKVAGINVTIDQNGIELSGKSILPAALVKTLDKTINTALKTIGLKIFIAQGTKKIHGPAVNLDSGDLVIELNLPGLKSQLNDTGTLLQLGGASITAVASPGYTPPKVITKISPTPQPTSTGASPVQNGGPVPPLSTGGSDTLPPAPAVSSAPAPAGAPVIAPSALALPGVLGKWWIALAILVAGLFAFGLKRLPDEVLKPTGLACNIEEGA